LSRWTEFEQRANCAPVVDVFSREGRRFDVESRPEWRDPFFYSGIPFFPEGSALCGWAAENFGARVGLDRDGWRSLLLAIGEEPKQRG
jgi:hypothetical protein